MHRTARIAAITASAFAAGWLMYARFDVPGLPLMTGLIYAGIIGPAAMLTFAFLPALAPLTEAVAVSRLCVSFAAVYQIAGANQERRACQGGLWRVELRGLLCAATHTPLPMEAKMKPAGKSATHYCLLAGRLWIGLYPVDTHGLGITRSGGPSECGGVEGHAGSTNGGTAKATASRYQVRPALT